MHGIIDSNALRLGNAQCLNDQSEYQFGWGIINHVFDKAIAKRDVFAAALAAFRDTTRDLTVGDRLFVCSLSARRDSLSQWQRYGANGSGYCLGFKMPQLLQAVKASNIQLRHLIYSHRTQTAAVQQVVNTYRPTFNRRNVVPAQNLELAFMRLLLTCTELALLFKTPHFQDEQEWRLILVAPSSQKTLRSKVRFSQRGNFVKPYIDIPVVGASDGLIPIQQIIYGPMLNTKLARSSLHYFLDATGHRNVKIEQSRLAETWR